MKSRVLQFGIDDVTIVLMWEQEDGTSYNVSVHPNVNIRFTGNTMVELTSVSYNTSYMVSIVATLCGRNNYTAVIRLNYGEFCEQLLAYISGTGVVIRYAFFMIVKCGSLLHLIESTDVDDAISVNGYSDPAVEGTTVNLRCSSLGRQFQLTGPNRTTCMGNGEWEPDPRGVECLGTS